MNAEECSIYLKRPCYSSVSPRNCKGLHLNEKIPTGDKPRPVMSRAGVIVGRLHHVEDK